MESMDTKQLLEAMDQEHVQVLPSNNSLVAYQFVIDQQPFGYLDHYGNLYLNEYGELISRPLNLGNYLIDRWLDWSVKGFRINIRRLNKWR